MREEEYLSVDNNIDGGVSPVADATSSRLLRRVDDRRPAAADWRRSKCFRSAVVLGGFLILAVFAWLGTVYCLRLTGLQDRVDALEKQFADVDQRTQRYLDEHLDVLLQKVCISVNGDDKYIFFITLL